MIDKESDARTIGYGAMLIEGLVGVVAMIAASALHPGDYFAMNTTGAGPRSHDVRPIAATNLPRRCEVAAAKRCAGGPAAR